MLSGSVNRYPFAITVCNAFTAFFTMPLRSAYIFSKSCLSCCSFGITFGQSTTIMRSYTHLPSSPPNFSSRFIQNHSNPLNVNSNACCPLNSAKRLSPPVIFLNVFSSSTDKKLISELPASLVPYTAPVPNRDSISFRSMPIKLPLPSRRSTRLLSCDFPVSPCPTRNNAFFMRQPFTLEIQTPINSISSCFTISSPLVSVSI